MTLTKKIGVSAASLVLLAMSTVSVAALGNQGRANALSDTTTADSGDATTDTTTPTATSKAEDARNKATEHQAVAAEKAKTAKQNACLRHETVIKRTIARIADRGQKQSELFTSIANRTETFYTNKGKTLANYDELVADVTTKQAAAAETLTTVKSDGADFSCDTADPKAGATAFKTALKSEIAALKDYRTAVKNLIVGVKSVQSTSKDTAPVTDTTSSDSTTSTTTGSN